MNVTLAQASAAVNNVPTTTGSLMRNVMPRKPMALAAESALNVAAVFVKEDTAAVTMAMRLLALPARTRAAVRGARVAIGCRAGSVSLRVSMVPAVSSTPSVLAHLAKEDSAVATTAARAPVPPARAAVAATVRNVPAAFGSQEAGCARQKAKLAMAVAAILSALAGSVRAVAAAVVSLARPLAAPPAHRRATVPSAPEGTGSLIARAHPRAMLEIHAAPTPSAEAVVSTRSLAAAHVKGASAALRMARPMRALSAQALATALSAPLGIGSPAGSAR